MSDRYAFVSGTPVIDVVATIQEFNPPVDHKGAVSIEFGGCAYNVAIDLQELGTSTTLFGVMNASPFSRLCANQLHSCDVKTQIKEVDDLPSSVYAGVYNKGAQTTAVTSMPLDHVEFDLDDYKESMSGSSCAIMSCEYGVKSISGMVEYANEINIPVFLAADSSNQILKVPEIKGHFGYCFTDDRKMEQLAEGLYQTNNWSYVADKLDTTFLVSMGKKGIAIVTGTDRRVLTTDSIAVTGNTLGINHLLLSCIIHYHVFNDCDIDASIELAFGHLDEILQRQHGNLGKNESIQENMQEVINSAHKDQLTKVFNRHGLEDVYACLDTTKSDYYISIVDIDHFKAVNDNFGHDAGDTVLVKVAQRLSETLRDSDILGRWGGEEFVLIVKAKTLEDAVSSVDRSRLGIEALSIPEINGSITISGGVAGIRKNQTIEEAIKDADKYLYTAKKEGRNKVLPSFNDTFEIGF